MLERHGYVATVTLNRPQKLNAVTPAMAERIETLVGEISRDEQIRAVLIKGAGQRLGSRLIPESCVESPGTTHVVSAQCI